MKFEKSKQCCCNPWDAWNLNASIDLGFSPLEALAFEAAQAATTGGTAQGAFAMKECGSLTVDTQWNPADCH